MKIFKIISLITFIVLISSREVDGQAVEWVNSVTGSAIDTYISTDAVGNNYITGRFTGTTTFGTTTLTNYNGSVDIFIAKYDNAGNSLWVKQAGGTSNDVGYGIAVDATGNSYITGFFQGTATFGITTLTSSGNSDMFIAKYDNTGNCLWAQHAGGYRYNEGKGISVDETGNSYITGFFQGTATFGTTTLTSHVYNDMFVAKYDNTGNCLWAQQAGGTYADGQGNGISVDLLGNSYITGHFTGTTTFGSTTLTCYGYMDMFIAKYDNAGNCLWVKQAGGTNYDEGNKISVDATGNSYITGYFEESATFGTTTLTSYGQRDIFIVKYDNAGNCLWVKQAGGIYTESGKGISESANGYVYVTGIGAEVNFGNINIINSAIFVAKISKSTILTITSPTGGENWQTNSQHNITWNSVDDGNIKIEITTNNGTDWFTLQASVAANLGNYTLTVPPFSTSSQCMIRLTSLSYGNVSTSSAITITSASVPNVTITSPNTYVKWNAGSSQNITWTLTGSVDNVKLEYTTENGTGWNTITNSTSASAQSYAWVVPNAPSTSCRIRVSDATNSALNDVSDVLFTIANITTTAPSGGEQWKSGTNKSITWTSTGVANVNLFYSTNSGIDWIAITSNITASTASYSWTVPSVTSAACKIKIADAFDATLFSLSNVFSIWQPLVSTHTPSTGTITQNFDLTNIDFSAFVLVADAITTTFYPYEAPQTGTLPGGVVGASQYYWLITSASVSFFNGVISVPLASLTGVTDATKLVWLKRTNSGDAWTNIGGSVSAGNLLSTVAFSSFSEFAIGTTDAVNPLPVELISFSKIIKDKKVILNWQTATEVNNYGFEIEKTVVSSQKSEWGKVGFVQGHGNSNSVKDYSFVDEPVTSGKYYYRLKQMDNDGKFKYSKEIEVEVNLLPTEYTLDQNFPNPFNPSTVIKYVLPFESNVKLLVYNLIGEVIKELVNETVSTGYQEVSFDAGKLSSGIYFYTLIATSLDGKQNYQSVKKMLLLK